jgi:hypothetical protein
VSSRKVSELTFTVLLLDEADVFLEERTTGYADLERNSLVSGNKPPTHLCA